MTDETEQAEPQADAEPIEPSADAADAAATEEPLTEAPEPMTAEAMPESQAAEEPTLDDAAPAAASDEPVAEPVAETAPETEPVEAVAQADPEAEQPSQLDDVAVAEEPAVASDATPEPEPELEADPAVAAEPVPEAVAEREGPMTMAELLEDPDNEVKSLKHGDVVEGTVVRIDPDEILVDFGGKSEGVVSNRELMGRRGPRESDESRPELSVGDEVLVYVLQPESPEGHAVLSLRRAGLERKWRAMQERFDAGEIVEARVIDHNKGGLIVDLGVRGFVPISQIVDFPRRPRDEQPRDAAQEIAEKLQPFVGRTLRLKILEVNR
ncbi:MAG TPA: S1 RNA-binding domain-containing protein, partial [Candidatus Limnocylindrales bacterium]|nr:S1 RNA-binding domain-containing protein [Candidatus Limnocylindrales bacterium]